MISRNSTDGALSSPSPPNGWWARPLPPCSYARYAPLCRLHIQYTNTVYLIIIRTLCTPYDNY